MVLDGSLESWPDIADAHPWDTLLVGNGLSINVWPGFAYRALFDRAQHDGLDARDRALFAATPNFENVLADLNTAARVAEILAVDPAPFVARYQHVQLALGHAVRAVHVSRDQVGPARLRAIRSALLEYGWIFTTSYDLLLYWAMAAGPRGFAPFVDMFRRAQGRYDARSAVPADRIPVYFLHGALHLVVGGDDRTRKRRSATVRNLLAQFGAPIEGDPHARPLLVTEGSARDKVRAIERSDYLAHVLDTLRRRADPVVVFGSSLSKEDQHLVDALNEHPDRPVAVSMFPKARRALAAEQSDLYARLEAHPLVFFDSTTHPLGAGALQVPA